MDCRAESVAEVRRRQDHERESKELISRETLAESPDTFSLWVAEGLQPSGRVIPDFRSGASGCKTRTGAHLSRANPAKGRLGMTPGPMVPGQGVGSAHPCAWAGATSFPTARVGRVGAPAVVPRAASAAHLLAETGQGHPSRKVVEPGRARTATARGVPWVYRQHPIPGSHRDAGGAGAVGWWKPPAG